MSTYFPIEVPCPACQAPQTVSVAHSINIPRRPADREALLADSLQRQICSACGEPFRLAPELVWFDAPRREWILVRPNTGQLEWSGLEEVAEAVFAANFGATTPPPVQAIGARLKKRAVFGWAALREKVYAWSQGLDDVQLELAKLRVMRDLPPATMTDDLELRLIDVDEDLLTMHYVEGDSGDVQEELVVPRQVYDDVAADPGWEALRAELSAGPYVDMQRLMLHAERAN